MRPVLKWTGAVVLFALGIFAVMILTRTPSHDRDWIEAHARLPEVSITGDLVTVQGIRNFSYSGPDRVAAAHYLDGVYDVARLDSVWYGVSHFSTVGIAHPFVSFLFDDGRSLALSIEARLEKGEHYDLFAGAMRNYEVIMVLGTDRDVIGLRSHWREEAVEFYQLDLERRTMRNLFRAFMEDIAEVAETPRFYNTLVDNCFSGLLRHVEDLGFFERWTDTRIWLPGNSAGLAYERELLDTLEPFEALRERSWVDPTLFGVDDPAFPLRIRGR